MKAESLHSEKWDYVESLMRGRAKEGFNSLINFHNGETCKGKNLSYAKGSFENNVHVFADIDDVDMFDNSEVMEHFKERVSFSFLLDRFIAGAEEEIEFFKARMSRYDTSHKIKLYEDTIEKFKGLK